VQVVTADPNPPTGIRGNVLKPPYLDPPLGGYSIPYLPSDDLPYVYNDGGYHSPIDPSYDIAAHTFPAYLTFSDQPSDPAITANQEILFSTMLVSIKAGDVVSFNILNLFKWESNYNREEGVGGVNLRATSPEPLPAGAKGGVTILSQNAEITSLTPLVRELLADAGAGNVSLGVSPSGFGTGRDAFVISLYGDDLGRLPEPSGLRFWSGVLAKSVKPKTVAVAIWNSSEHRTLVNQHLVPPISFLRSYADALRTGKIAARSHAAAPAGTSALDVKSQNTTNSH
jgi:hypothetical protein